MKKRLSLGLAAMLLLSILVGCSGSGASGAASSAVSQPDGQENSSGGMVIGVIPKSTMYDYWKMVRLGCEDAAASAGYTIRYQGTGTNTDVEGQIKIVEDFVTAGVDAIVISPVNADSLAPILEEASKTIPIIIMDGALNSDCQQTTVSTDNVASGAMGAREMVKQIGEEGGLVAVVSDNPGSTQLEQRERGFIEELALHEGYELLEVFYCEGDRSKAVNIVQDIFIEHPEIKGIFATNEGASAGVSLAIRDEARSDICVIGFDSSIDLVEAIYDNVLDGTVAQDPYNVGWLSIEAALKVLNGESVETSTSVPAVYVDGTNIHDPDIIKVLDPLGTLGLE